MADDRSARTHPLGGHVVAGRYRIDPFQRTTSRGGILAATDLVSEQAVALRLVDPTVAAQPGFGERFQAAGASAMRLRHPNLVEIHDVGVDDIDGARTPFLVVEHLAGGSLREMLDRGRLLTPSQALMVGLDVCRALVAVHGAGLLHGEVRPKHLLFGVDRRVRLSDSVVAGVLADRAWRDPETVDLDRARYAAPEQARGLPLAPPSDIYALCLCLIEAVTGDVPFSADSTVLTLANRVDSLMPVSADLGPLASVLSRAGRPDPADRFTAAEFASALVQAAQKLPRPAPIPLVGTGLFADTATKVSAPPAVTRPAATGWPGPDVTGDIPRPPRAPQAAAAERPGAIVSPPPPTRPRPSDPPGVSVHPATSDVPPGPPTDVQPVAAVGPGRQRVRRGLWWTLTAAALVVVAGLGVLAYQILSTKTHPVPALVGRDIREVGNLIAEFEWELVVERERNDDQPFDAVVRTVPAEGEQLAAGDTFIVVVSDGPTLSVLPQLEGLSVEDAEAALESVGFSIVVSGLRFDEEVPNGAVISWSVPDAPDLVAGDEVVKGTAVTVLASQGPEPRTVPSLIGRDPAEVVAELLELRLDPVEYPEIFSDDVEAGLVVAQDPPPGERLERGSEVRYSLSKGPDVVPVPPLAGLDYAGVVQAIESAGLQVGTVTGDRSLTLLGVSVGGSPVNAGELLRRDTAIDLVYSFPP